MRAALALVLLGLTSCAAPRPAAPSLAGTTWVLDRLITADGVTRGQPTDRLTFGTDGQLAVASCNLCSGPYTLGDGTLALGEPGLACTRRACLSGQAEMERYLTGSVRLRRDGEYLVLEPAAPVGTQLLLLPALQ